MKVSKSFALMFVFVVLGLIPAASASAQPACKFGYEGRIGPDHWWEICQPQNPTCLAGQTVVGAGATRRLPLGGRRPAEDPARPVGRAAVAHRPARRAGGPPAGAG